MKPAEIGVAQQLASQLLGCPTLALERQLVHIGEVAALLPATIGGPLAALAAHLGSLGLDPAAEQWLCTFDERCSLHLGRPGDHAFGDIVRFQSPSAPGRPDFLPTVLRYAAARLIAGDRSGQHLLTGYRSRMTELSEALTGRGSPYALAVDAVMATLPVPAPTALPELRQLAQTG